MKSILPITTLLSLFIFAAIVTAQPQCLTGADQPPNGDCDGTAEPDIGAYEYVA